MPWFRDGTVETHTNWTNPEILCNEGTVDFEVAVVTFANERGENIGALLHHTCHPVHAKPERSVSADWPASKDMVNELFD